MNSFQVVDWVTATTLDMLLNDLVVARKFNTDYNREFTQNFAIGDTARVKLPQKWTVRTGLAYTPQDINRLYTTVTIDQVFGIDFEWDSVQKALQMERGEEMVKEQYLKTAAEQLAQEIDSRAAQWAYYNTNNIVGALGTNPTDMSIAQAARTRMKQLACPKGDYDLFLSSAAMETIVNGSQALFNDQGLVGKAMREGYYGHARSFDWSESQSLYSHTAGVWQTPASVTISGDGQSGNSLLLNCTSGDTFLKGDVINIAAVYAVNPGTRRSTGVLKQMVVTANTTATGSTVTVPIQICGWAGSAGIVGPNNAQYQNVDALPLNTALVTLMPGTTTPSTGPKSGIQGLALHKDAFALVGVPLEKPNSAELSSVMRDPQTGLSLRFVRAWDQYQSKMTNRFDILMGFGNLYADSCSVRLQLGA